MTLHHSYSNIFVKLFKWTLNFCKVLREGGKFNSSFHCCSFLHSLMKALFTAVWGLLPVVKDLFKFAYICYSYCKKKIKIWHRCYSEIRCLCCKIVAVRGDSSKSDTQNGIFTSFLLHVVVAKCFTCYGNFVRPSFRSSVLNVMSLKTQQNVINLMHIELFHRLLSYRSSISHETFCRNFDGFIVNVKRLLLKLFQSRWQKWGAVLAGQELGRCWRCRLRLLSFSCAEVT